MKSFCIKTNNKKIINYLLKNLETFSLENIYFINKQFKNFENVIIHYLGDTPKIFMSLLADLLTNCIITFFEQNILKQIINFNYFYFDEFEKKIILENCYKYISSGEEPSLKYRKEEIFTPVLSYIMENKSVILDGFVTFRLETYHKTLEDIVDYSVNQYVVEKEYVEFINLLKMYINSKEPQSSLIHLVYHNQESILLDEHKNIIALDDSIFDAKYLSDISFSSNDYALNALLTLLPKKIEIHLIGYEDEFINTLKLIFGSRIFICSDCNICRTYKILNNVNTDAH